MTTRISIGKSDLITAAQKGAMASQDVESLWSILQECAQTQPSKGSFDLAQLFTYAGGVLVMLAMGWFMSIAQDHFGLGSVLALGIAYAAGFSALGYKLRFLDGQRIAGAVLFTLAVLMVPLTVGVGLNLSGIDLRLNGL